ncbi:MAG TPA: DUF448 domain-containing protein [Nitrospirota bacterium]
MGHRPERTCIGCRHVFEKDEVVRIVSGGTGIIIDYREKLPGRAAYVCPTTECIAKALTRDSMAKALRVKTPVPNAEDFTKLLAESIRTRIKSLISMSAKAGKLVAGYSAVQDALEKGRVKLLLFARDISAGTKEKLTITPAMSLRQATLFSRDELGRLLNRELVGVIGIEENGFADAVWKEAERLKGLINHNE